MIFGWGDHSKFTMLDAGYTATDYILQQVLENAQCKWVSVTNADNVYGSEIVDRVLRVGPQPISKRLPDMVLNPLDSRNFQNQGEQLLVC